MSATQLAIVLATLFPRLQRHLATHDELMGFIIESAARHHVRPSLLAAVGMIETGLGRDTAGRGAFGLTRRGLASLCRMGQARCEGSPLAAQADGAAAVLAAGRLACRTELGSLRYYHSGRCAPEAWAYAPRALRLANRIERAARNLPGGARGTLRAHRSQAPR